MSDGPNAYSLAWPAAQPRTPTDQRRLAAFRTARDAGGTVPVRLTDVRERLADELARLRAHYPSRVPRVSAIRDVGLLFTPLRSGPVPIGRVWTSGNRGWDVKPPECRDPGLVVRQLAHGRWLDGSVCWFGRIAEADVGLRCR